MAGIKRGRKGVAKAETPDTIQVVKEKAAGEQPITCGTCHFWIAEANFNYDTYAMDKPIGRKAGAWGYCVRCSQMLKHWPAGHWCGDHKQKGG